MHVRLKSALAFVITALMLASSLGLAQVAVAATPPFEPDPNARGGVSFFNASSNVVTGGSITDSPIAAYVQATGLGRPSDTQATLFGYLAQPGVNPGLWPGEQMSAGNPYPVATAPPALANSPNPLEVGSAGDLTLSQLMTDFPHPGTDPATYQGVYQIRIFTSGVSSGQDSLYWRADIQITGTTWTQVYPPPPVQAQNTTTTLTVSPASPQPAGTTVNLTATVTPSIATGTVQFKDGAANLGPGVSVTAGTATTSTNMLTAGSYNLTAAVVPYTITTAAPPFEPDPNTRGCINFFDAAGHIITGGTITDSPIAAYVQANGLGRSTDTQATLF